MGLYRHIDAGYDDAKEVAKVVETGLTGVWWSNVTYWVDTIPNYNGILALNKQWLHYFLTGKKPETKHTAAFSAQKMTTLLEWDDVVLHTRWVWYR